MKLAGTRAFQARLVLFTLIATAATAQPLKPWRATLEDRLRIYGHRNWIVVADSAYPLQSNPGIETILSNENQVETVRHTFESIAKIPHLRPVVYTDRELQFVAEQDAVGIGAYRQLLSAMLNTYLHEQKPATIPHETIIHNLDEASKTFNILIVKTNMALPYTSVFFELRAGYWSDDAERRLREKVP
jgi:hypothetical protein